MDKLFESFKTSNNFKTFLQHINCSTLAVSFALQNQRFFLKFLSAKIVRIFIFVRKFLRIFKFYFLNFPNSLATDEHFRYITSFACQKLIYVLEEARRLFAAKENDEEEDAQINKRRRKKKERFGDLFF